MIRNEDHWHDVENLEPFKGDGSHQSNAWKYLEKLQRSGHMTVLDIICLEGLIEAVYQCGRNSALDEVAQNEAGSSL